MSDTVRVHLGVLITTAPTTGQVYGDTRRPDVEHNDVKYHNDASFAVIFCRSLSR